MSTHSGSLCFAQEVHTQFRLNSSELIPFAQTENHKVTYYELPSIYGHDTFLLDVVAVGAAVKVGHRISYL